MKNKIIMVLISAVLLMTLSACDEKTSGYVSGGTKDNSSTEENVDKKEVEKIETKDKEIVDENKEGKSEDSEEKEKITHVVSIYFSDDQAESLVEKQIDLELSEGETLESKILEKLKSKPAESNLFNVIEENIKFNGIKLEEKIASVDISSSNLHGSSTQEYFLKDSILAALTSLDTIDGVKFLVDGKEVDTLMGHIEVSGILTKDNIETNIVK